MNTIDFFITGFPRSRLAWLSNYLYYGNMACIHDGLFYGLESKDFGFLNNFHDIAEVVGIADSGLAIYQDTLIEKYPEAKWIIVERPYGEVRQSIESLGMKPGNTLASLSTKIDELRGKLQSFSVDFSNVSDAVTDIARYVNPEWKCPLERHEMLVNMNVQFDPDIGKRLLEQAPRPNLLSRRAEPPIPTPDNAEAMLLLQRMCASQPYAYLFLKQAIEAALVWDHVIDGDTIDIESTNRTFEALLTQWPNNPFVRENAKSLTPVMANAIAQWRFGNDRSSHYEVYASLAGVVAFILGGMDMVNAYMPQFRRIIPILIEQDDARDAKTAN